MAVRTLAYGTRTAFPGAANLNSLANAAAKPLGAVDNTGSGQRTDRWLVDLQVTLPAASVSATGFLRVWLIQAPVNSAATDWTDGIDPAGTADVAASVRNARVVRVLTANANSAVIRDRFQLPAATPFGFWSLVLENQCGAALPSSGHAANHTQVRDDVT